jgi:PAS domain S-box-containing protein
VVADIWVPLGIGVGVLYTALVILSIWSSERQFVLIAAIIGSILIGLGFFIAPGSEPTWMAILNRVMSLVLLWLIVLLIPPYQRWHARTDAMRAHLAAIVESSDDAIISTTLDGIVLSWNRGAERIFGYAADEVIGGPMTQLMPPDRLDEEPEIIERLQRGERVDYFETVRTCKNGRPIDVSLNISPITGSGGRHLGICKIARDISQRRQGDEERERLLLRMLEALDDIKTLRGMLALCASCHKIRNDGGVWEPIEVFIQEYAEVRFTHGLCPDCLKQLYPTLF